MCVSVHSFMSVCMYICRYIAMYVFNIYGTIVLGYERMLEVFECLHFSPHIVVVAAAD